MEERFWFLFTRYLSKESSLKENEELKDIISGDPKYKHLFEQNIGLWNVKNKSRTHHFDSDKIKHTVLNRIEAESARPPKSYATFWRYAALFIFFIGLGSYFFFTSYKEKAPEPPVILSKSTGEKKRAMITLLDGTKVWLRENSTITYAQDFGTDGRRYVELEGEAYFNVTENANMPFVVKTGAVSTRVLGTQFNVRAFAEKDIEVTVETGKVLVESKYKGVSLAPNEQAIIDQKSSDIVKKPINAKNITVWKEPEIRFDMVTLEEAFFIIERYYNVDIVITGQTDLDCRVRSKYENENLETVLQGLRLIFNFDYEVIESDKVVISGGGC